MRKISVTQPVRMIVISLFEGYVRFLFGFTGNRNQRKK
jgi:hypothetical protein